MLQGQQMQENVIVTHATIATHVGLAMVETYLEHAEACILDGKEREARNYVGDALAEIKRLQYM